MIRRTTGKSALIRLGFADPDAAEAELRHLGAAADPLLAMLGLTADPDLALAALVRLLDAAPDASAPDGLLDTLTDDEGSAMRILAVLGASQALGEHLVRHPEHWRELTDPTLGSTRPPAYAMRESLLAAVAGRPRQEAVDALRVEHRRL
ncbi:MAG: bifunctional glutamine-synthetase adenylyltransferase/deadenyltransferase, partial [Nocardioides sp.]